MHKQDHFLIISGNGRNTGKTSFVCRVIAAISKLHPVVAVKVSPHFHPEKTNPNIFISGTGYNIWLETDPWSNKDSSRMLSAGAQKVYYVESKDEHLEEAYQALLPHLQAGPVIIESGGLRKLLEPGMFIMLNRPEREDQKDNFIKLSPLADKIVLFDGSGFSFPPENLLFDRNKWSIQHQSNTQHSTPNT